MRKKEAEISTKTVVDQVVLITRMEEYAKRLEENNRRMAELKEAMEAQKETIEKATYVSVVASKNHESHDTGATAFPSSHGTQLRGDSIMAYGNNYVQKQDRRSGL